MNFIKWIYSFFKPKEIALYEGEIHGSENIYIPYDDKQSSEKMDIVIEKIRNYGILSENEYDYIKCLDDIKKNKIFRDI